MIPYTQVLRGLANYVDTEIVPKLSGGQRWIIGAGLGIAVNNRGKAIFESLKANPAIKLLDIISDDDMVDIDVIYSEVKKQAMQGPITFGLPFVGNITLTHEDVDKAYNLIKQNGGALNETH